MESVLGVLAIMFIVALALKLLGIAIKNWKLLAAGLLWLLILAFTRQSEIFPIMIVAGIVLLPLVLFTRGRKAKSKTSGVPFVGAGSP